MSGLLSFLTSSILVFLSSYFLICFLKSKALNLVIYFILIFISQIIITIEGLSLINQINPPALLIANATVFIISFKLWFKAGKPKADFEEINILKASIINALKKDKVLIILACCCIFSSLISLFLALVVPPGAWNTLSYHLTRVAFWSQNHTLAHFETSSLRHIVFPINSELLMLWQMVFLKRDYLAILNQYLAYWGCILVLFSYLSYLKISMRRILWTIFIVASLPAVILESSSAQVDLIIAFLLFSSLYLFVYGIKEKQKRSLVFSAIAFAIALGTKNSAFFFIPILGIIYFLISVKEKGKAFYKPLLIFAGIFIPAFLLLSSYNYILNYIDFGNPFGPSSMTDWHKSSSGIKSFLASLINYFFLFIDFTGKEKLGNILTPFVMATKNTIFNILSLKSTDGLVIFNFEVNTQNYIMYSRYGLLGFILLLPLILKTSFSRIDFSKYKSFYINLSGLITIGFIITISALLGFDLLYSRFLTSAVILSSPVLILSYRRKNDLIKLLITFIVIFNCVIIPISIDNKPLMQVSQALLNKDFILLRNEWRLSGQANRRANQQFYDLIEYLGQNASDYSRIALIFDSNYLYYPIFEKNLTWKIFPLKYELLEKRNNYNDYDFIVILGNGQTDLILDDEDVKYNYSISGQKINFNNSTGPITIYMDKKGNPVDSGKPFSKNVFINFSRIPGNFKQINKIGSNENDMFYIYKRLSKQSKK